MSGPASLEILTCCSFTLGDISAYARATYAQYLQDNPTNMTSLWPTNLQVVGPSGLLAWKVAYPSNAPETDYGYSQVITTLCQFAGSNSTVINYDPMNLTGRPFTKPGPTTQTTGLFISSCFWGSVDCTSAVNQRLFAGLNNQTFTFQGNQLGVNPPTDGISTLVIVYGYMTPQSDGLPPQVYFETFYGDPTKPVTLAVPDPPLLDILGACYADADVTDAVQQSVDGQQTLTLNLSKLDPYLFPPMDPNKTLSVLYQYDGMAINCWAGNQSSGTLVVTPTSQPPPLVPLCSRSKAGESNVIALVWGNGSKNSPDAPAWPLADVYRDKIFGSPSFTPSTSYFDGIDPQPGITKSCHVYYQYGVTGNIQIAAAMENQLCEIKPKDTLYFDPLPALGLLRPVSAAPCFSLKGSSSDLFLNLVNTGTGSYKLQGTTTGGTLFAVDTATDTGNPFAMLKAYASDVRQWAYWGILPSNAWNPLVSTPAQFWVPGSGGAPSDPTTWAFALNYEVPSVTSGEGVVFAASRYTAANSPPYFASAQVLLSQLDGTVLQVPLDQGTDNVQQIIMEPQFALAPPTSPAMVAKVNDPTILDGCLMQTLKITKTFAWDLPANLLDLGWAGAGNIPWATMAKNLADWFDGLSSGVKFLVLTGLQLVQQNLLELITSGNQPGAADLFSNGMNVLFTLYNGDCLWTFIKAIVSGSFNWWTVGKLLFSLTQFVVSIINPATAFVQFAKKMVLLTLWVVDAIDTTQGWIRDCLSGWVNGLSASLQMQAVKLLKVARVARTSAAVLALAAPQRHALMMALTAPMLLKIDRQALKPEHPMISYLDAAKSPEGLADHHLRDPYRNLYLCLSSAAHDAARLLAPHFEKVFQ